MDALRTDFDNFSQAFGAFTAKAKKDIENFGKSANTQIGKFTAPVKRETGRFIDALLKLRDDPDAFSDVLKIIRDVGKAISLAASSVADAANGISTENVEAAVSPLMGRITKGLDYLDGIQLFADFHYFFGGQAKDDFEEGEYLTIGKRLCFFAANTGSCVSWLHEKGFDCLAHLSSQLGTIACAVSGLSIAGYAFGILEAGSKIYHSEWGSATNKQAWFDLVSKSVGIFVPILGLAGVACPPAIIALGLLSLSFGVISFVYGVYNKDQLEIEEAQLKLKQEQSKSGILNSLLSCIDTIAKTTLTNEGLEKISKLANSIITTTVRYIDSVRVLPYKMLGEDMKAFLELFESLAIFKCASLWLKQDTIRNKDGSLNGWKLVKQLSLTVVASIGFTRFLDSNGWISIKDITAKLVEWIPVDKVAVDLFGETAAETLGQVSWLNVARDIDVLVLSVSAIVLNSKKVTDEKSEISNANFEKTKASQWKWQVFASLYSPTASAPEVQQNIDALKAKLLVKYRQDMRVLKQDLEEMAGGSAKTAKLEKLVRKKGYIKMLKKNKFESSDQITKYFDVKRERVVKKIEKKADAAQAKRDAEFHSFSPKKQARLQADKLAADKAHAKQLKHNKKAVEDMDARRFSQLQLERKDVNVRNLEMKQNKNWVAIAADAAKIFIVILGNVAMVCGLLTLSTTVVSAITSATGIIVAGIGFGKFLYDAKQEEAEPHAAEWLAAATAAA